MKKRLLKIIKQMNDKQAMPPIDLTHYPTNKATTRPLKDFIRISAIRSHEQCDRWANELLEIANAIEKEI